MASYIVPSVTSVTGISLGCSVIATSNLEGQFTNQTIAELHNRPQPRILLVSLGATVILAKGGLNFSTYAMYETSQIARMVDRQGPLTVGRSESTARYK